MFPVKNQGSFGRPSVVTDGLTVRLEANTQENRHFTDDRPHSFTYKRVQSINQGYILYLSETPLTVKLIRVRRIKMHNNTVSKY